MNAVLFGQFGGNEVALVGRYFEAVLPGILEIQGIREFVVRNPAFETEVIDWCYVGIPPF